MHSTIGHRREGVPMQEYMVVIHERKDFRGIIISVAKDRIEPNRAINTTSQERCIGDGKASRFNKYPTGNHVENNLIKCGSV
jgi:hypothetical protein